MKFSHIADCHIGGWREPELRELGLESFRYAIEKSADEQVDFILISGDLFDNAMPAIELLKEVAGILKSVKDKGINVYVIAGSHDFSVSGKTMLDVFEKAGLMCNTAKLDENGFLKITSDKSGAKITGWIGKKAGLEKEDYKTLKIETPKEGYKESYKIFMFHSGIDEFKPDELKNVECLSKSMLPNGFDYYAGGHIHYNFYSKEDKIAFPGPVFPNNFKELEELKYGSFNFVENGKITPVPIKLKEVESLNINVDGLSSEDAERKINEKLEADFSGKILTLRISGVLSSGKPSDIEIRKDVNAFCMLKNNSKLTAREFEDAKIEINADDTGEIEEKLIDEHSKEVAEAGFSPKLVKNLMDCLSIEKLEDERKDDFEKRIMKGVLNVFEQN